MSDAGDDGERKFEVKIATTPARKVIDATPERPNAADQALASTFDPALAHDGKTGEEILEAKHDAELAVAGAVIVGGVIIAAKLAEHEEDQDAAPDLDVSSEPDGGE